MSVQSTSYFNGKAQFFVLLCSTLVIGLTAPSVTAGEFNKVISIGDAMPNFANLPDVKNGTLSSSDLTEDIVVMISLANHCPWVRGMDGDLVKLAKQFADQSVAFVGLGVNRRKEDRFEAMQEHAEKYGYTFHYVYDHSQALGRELGAARTPEYFVFDQQRKLAYTGLLYNSPAKVNSDGSIKYTNGDPTEFYVHDAVSALLAGNQPSIQETKAHGCSVKYENQ